MGWWLVIRDKTTIKMPAYTYKKVKYMMSELHIMIQAAIWRGICMQKREKRLNKEKATYIRNYTYIEGQLYIR